MSAVLFCGPTLGEGDLARYSHFRIRPPVRQGDLYAETQARPRVIGIVDGYFDGVPAVWHKEILWAIAMGIAVFGAASMGALRAAELHSFGMRGIGRIFEHYRDGVLTDDDDVALLHGPAESGYLKLSEPMVNIRATLERAVAEGIIDASMARMVADLAKAQFYQERSWRSVIEGATSVLPARSLERLRSWLPVGQVDQKRQDGLELLHAMDAFLTRDERQEPVTYSFQWTQNWEDAAWRRALPGSAGEVGPEEAAILDELRLAGEAYLAVRRRALLRKLAREEAIRSGVSLARKETARAIAEFRLTRRLSQARDLKLWAGRNAISPSRVDELIADQAQMDRLARLRDSELRNEILNQLRLENTYTKFQRRARVKADALAGADPNAPAPLVLSWYFRARLKSEVPDDLADYASSIGLNDVGAFYRLIAGEHALAARQRKRTLVGKKNS